MKKLMLCKGMALTLSLIISLTFLTQAQVAINVDGSIANNAAMLDVSSTSKGILIPRMTKAQRDLIGSPVAGLMIYQTDDTPGFYFHDGSGWKLIGSGAFSVNDLSDGKAEGGSVFLGASAGNNDDGTNNYNVGIGYYALSADNTGQENVGIGRYTLSGNTSGNLNTALGAYCLKSNTTGYSNTVIGYYAGYWNGGNSNTIIGKSANELNGSTGSQNTIIGFESGKGFNFHNKSGNVFIGYQSGFNEQTNNKLYIENSNSSSPLIYGEFDNNILRVNGQFEVKNGATTAGCIKLFEPTNNGNNFTKFQAQIQSADITYTLPATAGTDGQLLKTNGAGILSWMDDNGATQINDLSDAKVTGNSVFLGSGSGTNDDGTTNYNAALGIDALHGNTSGSLNSANGYQALYTNSSGGSNVAMGSYSLFGNTSGSYNVAFGNATLYTNSTGYNNTATGTNALYYNTTGYNNTANGYLAANSNTIGHDNVAIGLNANQYNMEGSYNTIIGSYAGCGVSGHNKSGNVFLGNQAGFNETGSNKLYIENSNASNPLIYGEFDNNFVTIYGNLGMATTSFAGGTRTFALSNGNIPTTSIVGGVLLYSEDVSSSSELKVRDEAGNVTTLSPHNFSMTNKSEPMAWSYYSENHAVGEKINVDMLRAIRLLEEMTGEKLVVIEKMDGQNVETSLVEQSLGIIQQQQKLIDDLLQRVEKLEKAQ